MQHSRTHLRTRPISAGHLRAFEAVARHLNFRAASEELALTQSAVSRQIQQLEAQLGAALFVRRTRALLLKLLPLRDLVHPRPRRLGRQPRRILDRAESVGPIRTICHAGTVMAPNRPVIYRYRDVS